MSFFKLPPAKLVLRTADQARNIKNNQPGSQPPFGREAAMPGNRLTARHRIDAGIGKAPGGEAAQSGELAAQGGPEQHDVAFISSRLIEPQSRGAGTRERLVKGTLLDALRRMTGEDHGSISRGKPTSPHCRDGRSLSGARGRT